MTSYILSLFNIGKIKYAPGSFASLIVAFLWYFVPNDFFLQLVSIILILLIGLICCNFHLKNIKEKDPQYIVIDEAVGMMIALFLIPKILEAYLLSFLIFRLLDILKPSIIYRSQNINYGIGVILDDVIAGFITFLIVWNMR